MKKLATRYDLHTEILSKFASEDDIKEAKQYLEIVGQDILWSHLMILINTNVSEKFIRALLECPKDSKQIIQVGAELSKADKLDVISEVLLSENECFKKDPIIVSLKLKFLSETNGEKFLQSVKELEDVRYFVFNLINFFRILY